MKRFLSSILILICLGGCAFIPSGDFTGDAGDVRLSVMCYNIHVGKGYDGVFSLERIAREIQESRADVVGLQEVDRFTMRNPLDEMARLKELTGMDGVFSKNLDFQEGEYGVAVLSRYPVIKSRSIHFPVMGEREPRGALAVKTQPPGGPAFWIVTTHLGTDVSGEEQLGQVKESLKWLEKINDGSPVIFTGDFNRQPGSEAIRLMKKSGFRDLWEECGTGEGYTFPAEEPTRRIDYIFLEPQFLKRCLNSRVPITAGSDHRPVVAEIILSGR